MRRALIALTILATLAGGAAAGSMMARDGMGTQPATPSMDAPSVPPVVPEPLQTPAPATPAPQTAPTEGPVVRVQQALQAQGFYVGAIDGRAGPGTASAVQAFQKLNGLVADGVIGPQTLAALQDPATPALRGGAATRIEVDLDRQLLFFVQGGELTRILPISSGSGETYATPDGGTAQSLTPVGTFTVERHIRGERNAPLGTLYDPMYFHGGWAIHGSNSVPAHPASHGCVRVTRADATWLFSRVPIGTQVVIHGSVNSFDPSAGESAGTTVPAGDTPETTPDDGIQTEAPTEPAPAPEPTRPPEPEPEPTPTPQPRPDPTLPPEPQRPDPTLPPEPQPEAEPGAG